jgi:hypothetical protein
MASPAPKSDPQPENHPLIKEFLVEYQDALDCAKRSKETTDTEAWRGLYCEHYKAHVKARQAVADRLENLAERLKESGWTEEDEKAVKDEVKAAVETRQSEDHFKRSTVFPIRMPVNRMAELWSGFQGRAANLASSQPMFGQEVLEELRRVYAALPKASFDDQTGAVVIETV